MKIKWIILLSIAMVGAVIIFVGSGRARRRLKKIACEREAVTLEKFYDFFPGVGKKDLDAIFHRLQDMLYIGHDAYFPIEPNDQIYGLYNIDREELIEMLVYLADEREIKNETLTEFIAQNENPTVSDIVRFVAGSK